MLKQRLMGIGMLILALIAITKLEGGGGEATIMLCLIGAALLFSKQNLLYSDKRKNTKGGKL